ncbi:MAG TPA: translation elongation factor Ts [Candidatus Sumerlaeota bacterium]|nr:MAG: Elongation factor Ts [candidate division BRC1 bacterium ADurb.BinA292]HOE97855.1 translation elongation factor Ts [Candidatus Sumerlaeota bacterium]HOR26409.1 translation elongation factor Ts [Candidatus Sumerlaeota bacterium]HPK03236.1 translation elongation factor Ts [Candidatus Sumerlaeota bacterium]
MAEITASMVKELREKTGAGMMDCKKALAECDGDMERAVDELRKRGQAVADKRGGRATREGLVFERTEGAVGVLVELNCETDFVARNDEFRAIGRDLADLLFQHGDQFTDPSQLMGFTSPEHGRTVSEILTEAIGKTGENMGVRRFVRLNADQNGPHGFITSYIHPPGKLGVLVEVHAGKPESLNNAGVRQLGRDLAMHIAAAAPVSISRNDVDPALVAREKKIYMEQAQHEGKPEKIWEKIAEGKLAKFYKQSCLLEQEFVKDPDQTIEQLVAAVGKAAGDTLTVARFERFEVGAGAEQEEA